jgi:hypothetical protein
VLLVAVVVALTALAVKTLVLTILLRGVEETALPLGLLAAQVQSLVKLLLLSVSLTNRFIAAQSIGIQVDVYVSSGSS